MPEKPKMKRLVYDLRWIKATGSWGLFLGGGEPIFAFHCTMGGKARALKRARQHARTNEPSQLRVYGKNGRIQFEHTYPRSSDPRPKAGSKRNRG